MYLIIVLRVTSHDGGRERLCTILFHFLWFPDKCEKVKEMTLQTWEIVLLRHFLCIHKDLRT